MVKYRSRAPLRLGLAGGGTDLSPYCDAFGGAILNATIDRYAYVTLEPLHHGPLQFEARDTGVSLSLDPDASSLQLEGELILHKAVYRRICMDFNGGRPFPCRLVSYCESPPGSGLGSSSTVVVALLKAFAEAMQLPLGDYDLAHLAFEIERVDAGLQGGRQDQYAATFGGFNFMEFRAEDRVIVNPLRVKNWILSELESSLLLYYTGQSRASAAIIAEQARNMAHSGPSNPAIEAMHQLKADAYEMKEALLRGDIGHVASVLNKSWEAKKSTASSITNSSINALMDTAFSSGAIAGKVSGAGGGGFVTFLVDPERRTELAKVLQQQNGQLMPCSFTKRGAEGWRID